MQIFPRHVVFIESKNTISPSIFKRKNCISTIFSFSLADLYIFLKKMGCITFSIYGLTSGKKSKHFNELILKNHSKGDLGQGIQEWTK